MTALGIIRVVCEILLPGLTYFAGMQRTELRYTKQLQKKRIRQVFDIYINNTKNGSGLDGLKKAGVATLHNDTEVRMLVKLIEQHGKNDPLQRDSFPELDKLDLKVFFDQSLKDKTNFCDRKAVEKLIEENVGSLPI